MDLSVIIAVQKDEQNFNTCSQILRQKLIRAGLTYEIIAVIGNESVAVKEEPDLQVAVASENRPTAFFNAGYDRTNGEIVLFIWDSILLLGRAIDIMYEALRQRDNLGLVGPFSDYSVYGKQISEQEVPCFTNLRELEAYARKVETTAADRPIMFLESGCFMVKKAVISKIGLPNTDYVGALGLEADLAVRALQGGFRLRLLSAFVHCNKLTLFRPDKEKYWADSERFKKKYGYEVSYSLNMGARHLLGLLGEEELNANFEQILDIGCAGGGDFLLLEERYPGAELYGLEFNPHAARLAQNWGEVYAADFESFYRRDWLEKFDLVIMGDVLEHLKEPEAALSKAYDMLRSGGILLISIPNVAHISNVCNLVQGRWHYEDWGILDRTHLRFFTLGSSRELLTKTGFSIEIIHKTEAHETEAESKLKKILLELPDFKVNLTDLESFQYKMLCRKE